jgi:hypothetical protein
MSERRIRVYVAGPYSSDPEGNTRRAIAMGTILMDCGFSPYIPHLTHYWHAIDPRPYEEWVEHDLSWVAVSEALLRLPGHSPGADREADFAMTVAGIPVFLTLETLVAWRDQNESNT